MLGNDILFTFLYHKRDYYRGDTMEQTLDQPNHTLSDLNRPEFVEVHNGKSAFSQYYHMNAPFSAVIETYRKEADEEYFKIVNFTPNHISHYLINDCDMLSVLQNRSLHQHDFFEFMFVLEGEVTTRIENTERIYPSGTGCILNCNLRHAESFNQSFRVVFLNLSKSFVLDFLGSFRTFQFELEKHQDENMIYQFLRTNADSGSEITKEYLDFFPVFQNQDSYQKIYSLTEQIFHTMLYPCFGATFLLNSLICQLFDCFSNEQYFHTTNIRIDFGTDFLLFTQMTHLLEDSNGHLSRRELAEILNYSGDYLNRIVKKYTGMTIFDYGMTFCIRKAEKLLLTTDHSVSEIATILGFSNRTHFYAIFSKKHGITPKEYRKIHMV